MKYEPSKSFSEKAPAEIHRGSLMRAYRKGEAFSMLTGLPVSWAQDNESVYVHLRVYVGNRWKDGLAASSRKSLVLALIPVVEATLNERKRGRPETKLLRTALRDWALYPPSWDKPMPEDIAKTLAWVDAASRPIGHLTDASVIRAVLAALATGTKGQTLGNASIRLRRSALYGALDHAVERKLLSTNPLTGVRTSRRRRVVDQVDPRTVPTLEQSRSLLAAAAKLAHNRDKHLHAWFAVMYYAGCRPGEVRRLRSEDCHLPATGWGQLTLGGALADVGGQWTEDGGRFDDKALKHRANGEIRPVPIPPALVTILRDHIALYGTAPDGRLFWAYDSSDHAPVTAQQYRATWKRVRASAFGKAADASPVARRPYDLRHGCASLMLTKRIPVAEIARRLGHSIQMLLTTYAHWLTDQAEAANLALDDVYGEPEAA
ncbi:tyrosine-type recombinase/integrase [Actinocorallia herbida]|nr:tyrosine-type recombinase/integrase [Actinocorallia herbida]